MNKANTDKERDVLIKDLNILEEWCVTNDMSFNENKCSVLHCGSKNIGFDYILNERKLKKATSEKNLGAIINKDMKFKDNITTQIKKANRVLGMIRRNFEYVNKNMFQTLYSMLVRPHLETAAQLWSPEQIGDQARIESVQRRTTKLVK